MQGRIIKALAGFYYVEHDGFVYQTRARGNFRKKGQTPYVGDFVEFSAEENSEGYILKIDQRINSLVRPPIVNIDQAVVIMSAKEPDFNSNLLDRFLVLLEHKNIKPVIYISKMDLVEDDSEMKAIQKQYQKIGFDFIFSLEELLPLLTDKITVFMGQTGVGKSTLLNRIAPQLHLETGEISDSLGRGRHTTRAVSLYDVHGGKIADTPGFSSLDYEVDNAEDLSEAFPEIRLDMFFFVSITTIIMAWTKIFPARKYTKYISWDILITIACAFAISKAMVNSGVADAVARFIIGMSHHYGPHVLLAAVFIITNLFTELITNNAAAALAFPLALSISSQMGVSPMPFFVVICMAASASFSTPIGYQTNLIVQGIGNYKFTDFVRIGLPLNIITFLISIFLIPLIWPF